ncbi:MAG: ATP-binding protein [Bacteroidales bacterium]|nr:ATP-binding protein [Bacteroidales bacterium]
MLKNDINKYNKPSEELLQRISLGENQCQDFKFAITDSKKIAKSLSAFANTDGGSLLIGVKDNGKIAGANIDEEYYMIETAAQIYCRPQVEFSHKIWNAGNKKYVLEIIIPKGAKPPYKAKDEKGRFLTYVRVNDENILADRVIAETLKRDSSKKNTRIEYSRSQDFVLKYIEEKGKISVFEVQNYLEISKIEAENILIDLILVGLLKPHFGDKNGIYYTSI